MRGEAHWKYIHRKHRKLTNETPGPAVVNNSPDSAQADHDAQAIEGMAAEAGPLVRSGGRSLDKQP